MPASIEISIKLIVCLLKRQSLARAEPETRHDSDARTRKSRFQVQDFKLTLMSRAVQTADLK
jgi:hypothetical protein